MYQPSRVLLAAAFMLATASQVQSQIPATAINDSSIMIVQLSPQALQTAKSVPALGHQSVNIDALIEWSSGKDIFVSIEIPSSASQVAARLHVSKSIELNKLNASLEERGFSKALESPESYVIPVFSDWPDDQATTLLEQPSSRKAMFEAALKTQGDMPVRAAVIVPPYFARTLTETTPRLPDELGSVETSVILDGTQWVSLGLDLEKWTLKGVASGSDDSAAVRFAETLPQMIRSAVNSSIENSSAPDLLGPILKTMPDQLDISVQGSKTEFAFSEKASSSLSAVMQLTKAIVEPISRRRVMENLRELGLAFHNYASANKSFPPGRRARGKDGKPLLSWRVHILPFLGEIELYNQFKFDEPWDSEHNKPLISKMPVIYGPALTTKGTPNPGYSVIQSPRGEKTISGQRKPVGLQRITDGLSNTVLVVITKAERAVPWTKPVDYDFDPADPANGLEVDANGAFLATIADGSVRAIEADQKETINALFTMNGGEVIP